MAGPPNRERDEQGSLVIAMGVLMIMTMLSMAVLTRTLVALTSVRHTQDYTTALGGADSGLADALYQIDQGRTSTFSVTNGTTGATTWSYTATFVDENTWTVTAQGTANKVKHAIQATVGRTVLYPYALFSQQDLTFNGNGGANIVSYNSSTGQSNTHHAVVGSDHAITISGGGGGNEQDFYTPNGSCSGCADGVQKNGPRTVADPTPPSSSQACPAGGTFGPGTINGSAGLAFVCNQNVTFSGTITVSNGPLVVYVGPNYSVSMSDAVINMGSGAGTTAAGNFQLLKAGTGSFTVGTGSHAAQVTGAIYAPSSNLTVDGGHMYMNGSLTVNQLTIDGNPNFTFYYDDALQTITQDSWSVSGWHEIPAS
jgi:Tfp pilus assembly protein PilX